ncbi:predicted protein [Postia placenta Mad-698-R]|nr:predicted protein [Postia placenta Mad-698-R]
MVWRGVGDSADSISRRNVHGFTSIRPSNSGSSSGSSTSALEYVTVYYTPSSISAVAAGLSLQRRTDVVVRSALCKHTERDTRGDRIDQAYAGPDVIWRTMGRVDHQERIEGFDELSIRGAGLQQVCII